MKTGGEGKVSLSEFRVILENANDTMIEQIMEWLKYRLSSTEKPPVVECPFCGKDFSI